MATPTRPDDIPRDEHLRAALRHAPDADLRPPPHLRAQIVAAAHRALAEPPAAAPARPLPWWRPGPLGASGALASVLLAGVIGLMWQDGPPGPALDESADAVPAAAPPAPMRSASSTAVMREMARGEPPTPVPQAPPAPPVTAKQAPAATAAAPAPAPARPAAPSAPAAEALAKRAPPAPQSAVEIPVAEAESLRPQPQPAADSSAPAPAAPPAAPIAEPVPPPSAPPAPAAAVLPPRPAPTPLPTPAAPPAAAEPAMALGHQAASARPEPARSRAAETTASGAAPRRWRIDGLDRGTAAPFWLRLAITRDRQSGQPSPLERLPEARLVELIDATGAVDQIWLGASQLLWCPADRSGCRLTPLTPDEAAALRRTLPPPVEADQTPKRDSR